MSKKSTILFAAVALALVFIYMHFFMDEKLKNPQAASAKVLHVQGKVERYDLAGASLMTLNVGDTLDTGDAIKTGAQSSMTIEFADKSKVLVSEETQLTMDTLFKSKEGNVAETQLRVEYGSIESYVSKQKGFGASYKVITPALQLSAKGTAFIAKVDKETGSSSATVTEGQVNASAQGKEVELFAGYATLADVGAVPAEPRKMLSVPKLDTVGDVVNYLPLSLSWQSLEKAEKYRLQLLSGSRYEYLAHDELYTNTQVNLINIPDAHYKIRVSGVDVDGIEGLNAEYFINLSAHPVPPIIKSPLNNAVLKKKKSKFYWDVSADASHYIFQVSDSENFSDIKSEIKNLSSDMKGVSLKLPSGKYYWRIASMNTENEQGPFSKMQQFMVERPLKK